MEIVLPEFCLVILIGPSGAGKSTFAHRHFNITEVLGSDDYRALVCDDANNQAATRDAFEVLHLVAEKRLSAGKLTVIDATNVQQPARQPLLALARHYHCQPVAVIFDLPEDLCVERNRLRPERSLGREIVHRQIEQLHKSLPAIQKEEFRLVYHFRTAEEVNATRVTRRKMASNLREDSGPFDMIGDVHGCCTELECLLEKLGYQASRSPAHLPGFYDHLYAHPEGRQAVFVGDLADRGPRILDTVELVRNMIHAGNALCVLGNHDEKLLRKLRGHSVQISHGLERTLSEIENLPERDRQPYREGLEAFLSSLPSHLILDHGRLVVAHAGIKKSMIGRDSAQVREFTLYGETTGEIDEFGLPVRANWAARYHGQALIVYGHTAVLRPDWLNHTVNIDTGCVYGGYLTALRYPELTFVAERSEKAYTQAKRPLSQGGIDLPPVTASEPHPAPENQDP